MTEKRPFPHVFWVAIVLELLERLAYYGVYINLAVYLTDTIGLSAIENGTLLGIFAAVRSWTPLAAGIAADRIGFRRSLALSFTLYAMAYLLLFMIPTRSGAWVGVMGMAVAGAFLKPVVPATVRRYSPPERRALGFSIFYGSVNAGSVIGKIATKLVREMVGLRVTMINAVIACIVGLGVTLSFFREPPAAPAEGAGPKEGGGPNERDVSKSIDIETAAAVLKGGDIKGGDIEKVFAAPKEGPAASKEGPAASNPLADLLGAVTQIELVVFVVLISGYYLLIEQFYQTFPTYIVRLFGEKAPREYITLINPLAIATLQVVVGRLTAKIPAAYAIALGVLIGSGSMLLMGSVPTLYGAGGAFFVFAIAEMFLAPRYYELISSFAPKGREATYMGISAVPVGIGGLAGGILSGRLISQHLPKEGPHNPLAVWGTYAGIGVGCATLLFVYAMWIQGRRRAAAPAQ